MKQSKYRGTGVAIITPFKHQKIDFDALTEIVNHVIDGGVDYIVALGSTGETATLNDQEAKNVLDHVIKVTAKRVPIVAGNFTGNNTLDLCEKIAQYDFEGIDALLISSPSYVKPSQEGIYHHFMALQRVSPLPIILYNVPGRTQSNMQWTTTVRLARDSKKFIGIKEASGDLIQATRIIKNRPDDFFVTSGDDEVAMAMVACGGEGVISVMANAFPMEFSQMIGAALEYDFNTAQEINLDLYDLHKWLYIEGNPVGIKSAMKVLGFCENEVRLPLHPLSEENYKYLKQEVTRIQGFIA
ncbi:4-hydroxy-tetrahydrodipicolinate synthase [Portibacter marinus]|uniref:4-hydroxy-tetrahydrodipicolinate synthase n=1 Tax=Portibacter marinus TaxID=2898660 RepID=UPI001F3013C5|nr:4-hydroxy-tetrahydrodipicolinate synthase [Portibacter marinus]